MFVGCFVQVIPLVNFQDFTGRIRLTSLTEWLRLLRCVREWVDVVHVPVRRRETVSLLRGVRSSVWASYCEYCDVCEFGC